MAYIPDGKVDYKSIGKKLRALRQKIGWSYEKVASLAGVRGDTVGKQERGYVVIGREKLERIFAALNREKRLQAAGLKDTAPAAPPTPAKEAAQATPVGDVSPDRWWVTEQDGSVIASFDDEQSALDCVVSLRLEGRTAVLWRAQKKAYVLTARLGG